MESIEKLYEVIMDRKNNPEEGSYTCYLFEAGLDKMLKKVGEESAETIIAAKNCQASNGEDKDELKEEICDLVFHLMVMTAECGISLQEIDDILDRRSNKIGNLKKKTVSDPLS